MITLITNMTMPSEKNISTRLFRLHVQMSLTPQATRKKAWV